MPSNVNEPHIDESEVEHEGAGTVDSTDFPTASKVSWWKKIFRRRGRSASDPTRNELENRRFKADTRNRNLYAGVLLVVLIAQLVAAHWIMFRAATGPHNPDQEGFYLSDQVLCVYLGSVVVEVIGLVYGIVRGIFPSKDE